MTHSIANNQEQPVTRWLLPSMTWTVRLDLLVFFRLQSRLAAIRSLPLFVLGFVLMHGRKRTDSSIGRQTLAPRMDVVSLQSMKRQVSDQVRYIQLELKKVTKHAKAAQKRTAQIYRVAIAILCMTDGADAAASSFLQIQCQHAVQENPTSLGTMVSEVIELYKHMSQEEKDALCAAVSGSPDFEANRGEATCAGIQAGRLDRGPQHGPRHCSAHQKCSHKSTIFGSYLNRETKEV